MQVYAFSSYHDRKKHPGDPISILVLLKVHGLPYKNQLDGILCSILKMFK